jgi:hypothetical protein
MTIKAQVVKFKKTMTCGKDTLDVYVFSEKINVDIEWITVDIVNYESDLNKVLYSLKTDKYNNDENRYIDAVKECFNEWVFRQHKDKAAEKFSQWDGDIKQ